MRIDQAKSEDDLAAIRDLIRDYQHSLDVDLSVQDIDQEIATLPGAFASPQGALFLARDAANQAIGCLGLRPFTSRLLTCELKRLFVQPAGRRIGIGQALLSEAILFAGRAGYRDMLLDSLSSMTSAMRLYGTLGFVEIPAYWNNPLPDVRYFWKQLAANRASH